MSPLAGAVEAVAADWLLDFLELPRSASVGFVTGAHMANVTALAVARHQVLRQAGWDVEADGLQGAPQVTVFAGTEAHSSIGAACRLVGLGARTIVRVLSDGQGRMIPEALSIALRSSSGPRIVCAQAGNVNTGACDPFPAIVRAGARARRMAARRRRLRSLGGRGTRAASLGRRPVRRGFLDDGRAQVAQRAVRQRHRHRRAARPAPRGDESDGRISARMPLTKRATAWTGYPRPRAARAGFRFTPSCASWDDQGSPELVERCCRLAERMALRLRERDGISVLNEVVLNQVLVRFETAGVNVTPAVIDARSAQRCVLVRRNGPGRAEPAMRISISNWSTTESDIDRSADAIVEAFSASAN